MGFEKQTGWNGIMKKLLLFVIFLLCMSFSVLGDTDNITNCPELQNMSNDVTLNYTLMNDIDCSDTVNWNSGQGFEPIQDFNGRLEGNGYTISDLFINRSGNAALFYNASGTIYVQNVTFDRPKIISNDSWAATILASSRYYVYQQSGGVIRIYNSNVLNGSINGYHVGGMIGSIVKYNLIITDSNVVDTNITSTYSGNGYAGGIIGFTQIGGQASLSRLYFKGNIVGNGSYKGGIIAYSRDHSEGVNKGWRIQGHYLYVAEGTTIQCTGQCNYIGGIVGYARHNSLNQASSFNRCISHANITIIGNGTYVGSAVGYLCGSGSSGDRMYANYMLGTGYINITGVTLYSGGVTGGTNSKGITRHSFWDTQTTGQTECRGDNTRCYGNTTQNLYLKSGYEDNNWDFTTPIFAIFDRCTYPYLLDVPLSTPSPAWCPPVVNVSVTNPANNTLTNITQDVVFTATADNATYSCDLYVDGSLNQTNSSVQNGTTTTFVQPFSDGVHTFELQCTEGLYYYSSGIFYYYQDSQDPQIMSLSPLPFNTTLFTNYTMNIYGNATNLNLSNVSITISYPNGSLFYANETTSFGDPTTHIWNWTFNTAAEPSGGWEIYIYAEDNLANTKEQYITFYVNNCVPNFMCGNYAACNFSNLAPCNETTDLNNCSYPIVPDPSTFSDQPCNYCSGDFTEDNRSECIDNIQLACYTDNNFITCCNVTNDLVNDCLFGVVQESGCQNESCGGYSADYSASDVAPATINALGTFILVIALFIPIIIIGYLGYLGWRKVWLMRKK